MRYFFCLLVAIALASATLPAQQPVNQNKKDQAVEKEIRRLNAEEHDAFMRADAKSLAKIWSDEFVVTNPFNQFATKRQVLKLVENGTLAFKSFDRNIEYVRIYGNGTAVVAGSETCVWAGKIPIAGQLSNLRFTSVWMKQAGRWQQVARHANIINPNQAKPAL